MDIQSRVVPCVLLLVLAVPPSVRAGDLRSIELRRLFEPTASELHAEAAGRVYIYEGLRDSDIARAMENAFDRVDRMMFIRVQRTAPAAVSGEGQGGKGDETQAAPAYYTIDDGC